MAFITPSLFPGGICVTTGMPPEKLTRYFSGTLEEVMTILWKAGRYRLSGSGSSFTNDGSQDNPPVYFRTLLSESTFDVEFGEQKTMSSILCEGNPISKISQSDPNVSIKNTSRSIINPNDVVVTNFNGDYIVQIGNNQNGDFYNPTPGPIYYYQEKYWITFVVSHNFWGTENPAPAFTSSVCGKLKFMGREIDIFWSTGDDTFIFREGGFNAELEIIDYNTPE